MSNLDDIDTKLARYESFLNERLQPDLDKTHTKRTQVENEILEYESLLSQLEVIEANGIKEFKTLVDIDCHVYMQAKVPDSSFVYIRMGSEKDPIHVQMTFDEARIYIGKKLARLHKKQELLSKTSGEIKAHIQMVVEATAELFKLNRLS